MTFTLGAMHIFLWQAPERMGDTALKQAKIDGRIE